MQESGHPGFCTVTAMSSSLAQWADSGADVLDAFPANLTGVLVGYGRVSTKGQLLDRQILALEGAGCARIFADKLSGKNAERPELWKALNYARPGDTLVVPSLDRLGRSIQDLIAIVAGLRKRGVGFHSLHESLDTTTPGGRLVFHVFAALAEFIRELIIQGTHEGLAAARPRRADRPPAGDERRADPTRPRDARRPGGNGHLDRQTPGRLPDHALQVRPRAEGRRAPRHRRPVRGRHRGRPGLSR